MTIGREDTAVGRDVPQAGDRSGEGPQELLGSPSPSLTFYPHNHEPPQVLPFYSSSLSEEEEAQASSVQTEPPSENLAMVRGAYLYLVMFGGGPIVCFPDVGDAQIHWCGGLLEEIQQGEYTTNVQLLSELASGVVRIRCCWTSIHWRRRERHWRARTRSCECSSSSISTVSYIACSAIRVHR